MRSRPVRGRGESLDDLVQVGAVGLIKAVDRFDPSSGVPLAAYAIPTIQGEIRRHLRDAQQPLRMPRGRQELGADVIARARRSRPSGTPPTAAELAEARAARSRRSARRSRPSVPSRSSFATTAADSAAERRLELGEQRALIESGLQVSGRRGGGLCGCATSASCRRRRIAAEVGLSQVHVSRLLRESLGKLRPELGQP